LILLAEKCLTPYSFGGIQWREVHPTFHVNQSNGFKTSLWGTQAHKHWHRERSYKLQVINRVQ